MDLLEFVSICNIEHLFNMNILKLKTTLIYKKYIQLFCQAFHLYKFDFDDFHVGK